MAVSFTRVSCWLWRGKDKEPLSNGPTQSSPDWGVSLREPEKTVRFPPPARGPRIASSPRKVKRKWQSREERRIDREYDVVLVPSDGVSLSGTESDESDWSIGWMEPHAPDFQSDDEDDNSFAVLVPCYRQGREDTAEAPANHLMSVIKNLTTDYPEGKKHMEQWLSSLHNC